jgi:glycine oxidase
MVYDYLIIGQGLAGTHVAWQALGRGEWPLVIDQSKPGAASQVAGGLVNPVTGRRLTKTWGAETLIPFAEGTYRAHEARVKARFYFQKPIARIFKDEQQKDHWHKKRRPLQEYYAYVQSETLPADIENTCHVEKGGVVLKEGGFLNTKHYLEKSRDHFDQKGLLKTAHFDYNLLGFQNGLWEWEGFQAKYVIGCEGWQLPNNPYFASLPLKPVKGQVLTVDAVDLPTEQVINKGFWMIPVGGREFRVGATYEHDITSVEPSAEGFQQLTDQLDRFLKVPYKVLQRESGVRPTMPDSLPVAGWHPSNPQMGILNGLGSKGVLQAPYLASSLLASKNDTNILTDKMNVKRYL